ncbi:MAG: methyltransferase domain-containing protein [Candidatus Coatesbacteria bacterium]
MPPICPVCGSSDTVVSRRFISDTFGEPREFEHLACPACTHIFVHPTPSPADLAGLYASPRYYLLTDTERALPDGTRDRPRWKVRQAEGILALMQKAGCRGGRLLDVGCGWGLFMERAAARGFSVAGLEPSHNVAEYVRTRLGLAVAEHGIEEAGEGSSDVITMLDVLEHVPDPKAFLELARRALKPGGWICVNVPNSTGLTNYRVPRLLDKIRKRDNRVFLQHLSEFSRRSLLTLFRTAGFEPDSVRGDEQWRHRMDRPFPRNVVWMTLSGLGIALGMPSSWVGLARKPV